MEKENFWDDVEQEINLKERENVETDDLKELAASLPAGLREMISEEPDSEQEKSELSREAEALIDLRYRNLFESLRKKAEIDEEILLLGIALRREKKRLREGDKRVSFSRNALTDFIVNKIEKLNREKKALEQKTPESYVGIKLMDFKEQIQRLHTGLLVETEYVKKNKEEVLENMENGEPVFIHGHLGAGKTDFAIHTSVERMMRLNIEKELDQWMEENENASKDEIYKKHQEIEKKYQKGFQEGDEYIVEKVTPFVISGSKDFSLQDLYTEKTLKLTKFNGKTVSEHTEAMEKEFADWQETNNFEGISEDEKLELERKKAEDIRTAYKMKHQGFGTEVEKVEKELLQAIKQGKPIIIDEANAIPPTLLISMNDLLNKRAGEKAFVPGEGPVEVKEGFSVVMTGNISDTGGLADYLGTEEMNPAFLSRLKVKEYDYLPQNTAGLMQEQKDPSKNELFQLELALLAEKKGGLNLPAGSLEKLFNLAQFAKVTQRIFSGKWEESNMNKASDGIEPELKKAVMSPRNMINVIRGWDKGQKMDLSMALWREFISNTIVPEDQKLLLSQARSFGFFPESEGWSWSDKDGSLLNEGDIRKKEYEYVRPEEKKYSPRDVIQIMHGPAPDRLVFPDLSKDALKNKEVNISEIAKLEEIMEGFDRFADAYQEAMEKEGCSI